MVINIPFRGFYNSWYSYELDSIEENEVRYRCEYANDPLDMESREYAEILSGNLNYQLACELIAKEYVEHFNEMIYDQFGIRLDLEFESLSSPREYNFETDRIFCRISEEKAQELYAQIQADKFAATIKKRFTSCDGFISHYSNKIEDWIEKPLLEWDYNELGTLLYALISNEPEFEFEFKLFDRMTDTDCFRTAWDQSVNWPRVEQDIKERHLIEAGECDDGKFFPVGQTDMTKYINEYCSRNGLKA